jgi:hypothetical protein
MMTQEILVPEPEVVATSELKVDGKNPNKMSREQHDRLKASIKKFGFIVPIITNKDLLIADGEQRWIIAKELAMPNVLIIRLPMEEVDRHLIRQVLNKLKEPIIAYAPGTFPEPCLKPCFSSLSFCDVHQFTIGH